MTQSLFLITLLISGNAFAHGDIEAIDCVGKKEKTVLKGTPAGKGLKFNIEISKDGKPVYTKKKLQVSLKDLVQNKQVVEQITLDFGPSGKAVLEIPEDYSKEVRPGKGTLALNTPKLTSKLSCTVKY